MECVAAANHYLNSEHTRIVAHSRSSNRQIVFLTSDQSSKNQWQIESYAPLLRPEYEDKPATVFELTQREN